METKDKLKIELTVADKAFPMHVKIGKSMVTFNEEFIDMFAVLVREIISVRRFGTRYDNLTPENMEAVEELCDKASDGKEEN